MEFTKSDGLKRVKLFSSVLLLLFLFAASTGLVGQNQQTQAKRLSGIVIEKKTGEPLIGVSILVKGTTVGTITDLDGKFSIELPSGNSILSFNYIGYKKTELEAPKNGIMSVSLEDNSVEMNEVVVVGYGTVKKSDLTGSISTVSTKEMKNTSILSADQALQGRATGVLVVNNSGAPGSPVSIKVRGIGTFGNTDPLYIVDGMPIKDASFGKNDNPTGINFLNPNDIESMQILKDASAAAIYGTRGANGVIIITTKRGKSGKMSVNFDNYFGVQTLPSISGMKMTNSQQFATLFNEVSPTNKFTPASIPGLSTTNWIDAISHNAMTYNNQLSVSGGNDANTFYLSVNNFTQDGIINRSKYERQSLKLNVDSKVNSWLKIGESMTIMHSNRDRQDEGVISSALKADPTVLPFDSVGNWSYTPRFGGNPRAQVDLYNYNFQTTRLQGSLYAEVEILKNLKYKLNLGLDKSWDERNEFLPTFNYSPVNSNAIPVLALDQESWNNWLIENLLSYNINIDKHSFGVVVGYTSQYEIRKNVFNKIQVLNNDPSNRYLGAATAIEGIGGSATEWGIVSQLGRLNYSYDDKYLLTASVRRDGSSRFGAENRYAVFPSGSVAWKITNEDFFKQSELLSKLSQFKVRLGWGQVGNQNNLPPYAYNGSVTTQPDKGTTPGGIYMGSDKTRLPFYVDYTVANPTLGWETNTSSNFGLDLGFWKDKLIMTIDLYNKTTIDQLMQRSMPMYFSQITPNYVEWGKPFVNLGNINNKGIEYSVTYRSFENELTYDITANISKNINKVVSLEDGTPPTIGPYSVIQEGQALGTFKGYKTEGIFQNQDEIDNHAFQNAKTKPGDLKYKDVNGDGKISDQDQTFIGNAFPDFNFGLTLNMAYKGFDLSVFTQGVSGNKVYNQLRQNTLYNFTVGSNVSTDLLNAWGRTLEDGTVVTNTNVPRLSAIDNNANKRFSDYWLEDGSYFRIKSITLGYNIKSDVIAKLKLSNLRVYGTVQNVFTFTKYTGFNPEIGQSNGWNSSPLDFGVDGGTYPQARIFMGGVNISF